jgi:hypothetical protein
MFDMQKHMSLLESARNKIAKAKLENESIDLETAFYQGETDIEGFPNGWGEIRFKEADLVIQGQFYGEDLDGFGICVDKGKCYHAGMYKNGYAEGPGIAYGDDGEIAEGIFKDGELLDDE